MHSEPQGGAAQPCAWCTAVFTPKRGWSRFCSTKCRNGFHAAEARKEAMREAAPDLYAALLELRKAIDDYGGHGMPGFKDRAVAYVVMGDADRALAKAGYKPGPKHPVARDVAETIAEVNAAADRRDAATS